MMDEDGYAHILCSEGGIQSAVPEIQEAVIKKWAAEHPESVYPTWGEWLQRMYNSMNYAGIFITPIPADIAQKLGVPPKPIDYCKEAYRSEDGTMRIRKTPIYPIEPKEGV